jgi:hypothetical protein
MTKKTSNRFSPEVRQRAVRMVLEHGGDHASQLAAIGSVSAKIGWMAETLRKWVRPSWSEADLLLGLIACERCFRASCSLSLEGRHAPRAHHHSTRPKWTSAY